MNAFDTAAVLLAIAALCGYLNHRLLRLPATSGTLAVALISSLAIVAVEAVAPALGLRARAAAFLEDIDFNRTLMRGLLSFLLFAGALHVDLEGLWRQTWTIGVLSTLGVIVSTAVVGVLTWAAFSAMGASCRFSRGAAFAAASRSRWRSRCRSFQPSTPSLRQRTPSWCSQFWCKV